MGDPAMISFTHDFLRNLGSGIEEPMELQPGHVNWAPVNPQPQQGTEVLATYADQFHKGSAAATSHRLGKGRVIYIGTDSLNGDLEADLLWTVYNAGNAKPARLPLNMMVDWRDGFWVATNFTDTEQAVPTPQGTKILAGVSTIPPGGVAVWQ